MIRPFQRIPCSKWSKRETDPVILKIWFGYSASLMDGPKPLLQFDDIILTHPVGRSHLSDLYPGYLIVIWELTIFVDRDFPSRTYST